MTPAVVLATAGRRSGLQLSLTDVAGEGIHVRADGVQLVGSRIRDGRPARVAGLAHVDAVQLIPPAAGVARGWYAGSVLRAVVVADCTVLAPGARLQGMTGFDGAFVDLRITGNAVWSAAAHLIHVNGWLSGECRDNRDQHGAVIRVTLYPVRIGGGPGLSGQQVWVIGFAAQSPVQYGTVVGDIARDLRQQRWNDRDVFLADFDYEGFRAAAALLPGGPEAEVHAEQLKQLAVAHGRRVGAEQQHEDHEMTMGNDVLQGMLRHVLTTVGGLAVGYGWLTAANLEMLVGLVMAMAGFVWSYYNKQQVG